MRKTIAGCFGPYSHPNMCHAVHASAAVKPRTCAVERRGRSFSGSMVPPRR